MAINLTDREKQCLRLAASGMMVKQTANALEIKKVTVNAHLRNARKKLGARNTTQAVSMALILNLLAADHMGTG